MHHCLTKALAVVAASAMTLLPVYPAYAQQSGGSSTRTPIKHVVVIFQENVSFDHYFGTYPHAANLPGERPFHAAENTPGANTLEAAGLLTNNPNKVNPFRIPPSIPVTCDEDHNYNDEQAAFDGGLMDKFVEKLTCNDPKIGPNSVMGYYDGNTVTALWNYAQHFAMSDNFYGTTFGPSTPGAVNLISGQTNGAVGFARSDGMGTSTINNIVADGQGGFTMFGDSDPHGDVCSSTTSATTEMTGKNVGDLLNAKSITWGWFQGGFNLTAVNANGSTGCTRT